MTDTEKLERLRKAAQAVVDALNEPSALCPFCDMYDEHEDYCKMGKLAAVLGEL